jgi:dihydroorotase
MKKTLLKNGSLVTETGVMNTDVLISITGEIEAVEPDIKNHKDADVKDCTGMLLFPLLIDCHVHFREPGLTHKATMETESRAALAGGVGLVCEMPNTIPPTVTIAALADKVRTADKVDQCIIKFYFGVTEAAHLFTLRELWTGESLELKRLKHHCCGVKLYLDHSTGNQKVDGGIVKEIFQTCADLKIPLIAHCEDPEMNAAAKAAVETRDARVSVGGIALHSEIRPAESEEKSIREAIGMVKKTGAALHIAHLSTQGGVQLVREAKKQGLPITCEVAPHHLFLTIDDYKTLGTLGKMNPPLRTAKHRDALWAGIADGTVDCISTDHAPHTLDEKKLGAPLDAPSGVPGVETMLPLLLTEAAKKKISYSDILRLCFTNPNRIFRLGASLIAPKTQARIAIIDPEIEWTITGTALHYKCGWTPYEGWKVRGKVLQVIAH